MPCNGSYMNSTSTEKELTKVVLLLDELNGEGPPDPDDYNRGYDSRVYCKSLSEVERDRLVAELCSRLSEVDDISKYSLEMQVWWRDHQAADKERIEREIARQKTEQEKQQALSKLSEYEKRLLGLNDR